MNRTLKIALILVSSSFMISFAVARRGGGSGGGFRGGSFSGGRSTSAARSTGARVGGMQPQFRQTGRFSSQRTIRMAPARRMGPREVIGRSVRPATTQQLAPMRYRQIRPIPRETTLAKPTIGRTARYQPGFKRIASGKSLARQPFQALSQKQQNQLRNFRRNWQRSNWQWGHPGHWWRQHWWAYSPWWWWGFAWDPWWAYEIEPIVVVNYDDEDESIDEDNQLQERIQQLNQKIDQMYQGAEAQARALNELIDQFNKAERKFEKLKGE